MKLWLQRPMTMHVVTTQDQSLPGLNIDGWTEVHALTGLEYSGMTPPNHCGSAIFRCPDGFATVTVSVTLNGWVEEAQTQLESIGHPRCDPRCNKDMNAFMQSSFIRFSIHMQEFMDVALKSSWMNSLRVLRIVV